MPQIPNRLHNRQSGVVKRVQSSDNQPKIEIIRVSETNGTIDKIDEGLLSATIVDIDTLVQDPMNARLHPEQNLKAIKHSLTLYGQVKPLVVRRSNNVIVAGNGTHEAAKALGWTKIACVFIELDDTQALGYGLADNKTAELAKWDFEVVARIDKLLEEAKHPVIGFTDSEIEVMRIAVWNPPKVEDYSGKEKVEIPKVEFTDEQYSPIKEALALYMQLTGGLVEDAEGLSLICKDWLEIRAQTGETNNECS